MSRATNTVFKLLVFMQQCRQLSNEWGGILLDAMSDRSTFSSYFGHVFVVGSIDFSSALLVALSINLDEILFSSHRFGFSQNHTRYIQILEFCFDRHQLFSAFPIPTASFRHHGQKVGTQVFGQIALVVQFLSRVHSNTSAVTRAVN